MPAKSAIELVRLLTEGRGRDPRHNPVAAFRDQVAGEIDALDAGGDPDGMLELVELYDQAVAEVATFVLFEGADLENVAEALIKVTNSPPRSLELAIVSALPIGGEPEVLLGFDMSLQNAASRLDLVWRRLKMEHDIE